MQAMLELLADDPRPPAARKLTGRPEWRVRSGDYRIITAIEDGRVLVVVVTLGPCRLGRRDTVYR